MKSANRLGEVLITRLIQITGYSAVVFVGLIFVFLFGEGAPTLREVPLRDLFSSRWYPIEGSFGILPLLAGSLMVTFGAALIAVPLGIATAVFVAEVAPRWAREILKPFIEVLAGLPSVMLGFLGIIILAPGLYTVLSLPTGLTAFTGALLLAWIALPTIVSVAEDALDAVPRTYRDAALALGATRWQTIWRVTLPAARSGTLIAVMLGVGRALGETMAVMMVTGNAPVLKIGLTALFSPVRTMTATVAAEMGEVASGSAHYHTLFFIGIVLFLISLAVNLTAASVVFRQRTRAERVLS
ncbi:MAG TPA: phosphate ABC transporter permease subunit PstC [Anaerolineales bacterium]|nr:phosphate ABC transporter permease subunit PstC [Anaerolineales bacterium]